MFQAGKNDRRREKTYDKRKKEKGDRRKMDGKETAKRKQVLEGNAFYEIDLECMRKKEKREIVQISLKENIPERNICMLYDCQHPLNSAARQFRKMILENHLS